MNVLTYTLKKDVWCEEQKVWLDTTHEIEVGTLVTYGIGSDSYGFEVVAIDGKTVLIKRKDDKSLRDGELRFIRQDRKGEWREAKMNPQTNRWKLERCGRYYFGQAINKLDPSF